MLRTCRKCGETKPIEEFVKNKLCRYGRMHICKTCNRVRLRQWEQENRDEIIEKKRAYYQENKKRIKARCKQWRIDNYLFCDKSQYTEDSIKICSKCGKYKPRKEFHKKSYSKDGRMNVCRECRVEEGKAYRRRVDPDTLKKRQKETRWKRRKAHIKEAYLWGKANPEKKKASARKYSEKQIQSLGDCYLRRYIAVSTGLDSVDITPEMIELKRAAIQLHRTLKEFKKWRGDNEQSDCQNV